MASLGHNELRKKACHQGWGWVFSSANLPFRWTTFATWQDIKARFLSLARSKLRLCSANHRAGYVNNLSCYWLSIVWTYSKEEAENRPSTLPYHHITVETFLSNSIVPPLSVRTFLVKSGPTLNIAGGNASQIYIKLKTPKFVPNINFSCTTPFEILYKPLQLYCLQLLCFRTKKYLKKKRWKIENASVNKTDLMRFVYDIFGIVLLHCWDPLMFLWILAVSRLASFVYK